MSAGSLSVLARLAVADYSLPVLAVPSNACWKSLCIGNGWQWLVEVCLYWQCLAMSAGSLSVLAMAGSG